MLFTEAFDEVFGPDQFPLEEQSIDLHGHDALVVLCKCYIDRLDVEALWKCFLQFKFIVNSYKVMSLLDFSTMFFYEITETAFQVTASSLK